MWLCTYSTHVGHHSRMVAIETGSQTSAQTLREIWPSAHFHTSCRQSTPSDYLSDYVRIRTEIEIWACEGLRHSESRWSPTSIIQHTSGLDSLCYYWPKYTEGGGGTNPNPTLWLGICSHHLWGFSLPASLHLTLTGSTQRQISAALCVVIGRSELGMLVEFWWADLPTFWEKEKSFLCAQKTGRKERRARGGRGRERHPHIIHWCQTLCVWSHNDTQVETFRHTLTWRSVMNRCPFLSCH